MSSVAIRAEPDAKRGPLPRVAQFDIFCGSRRLSSAMLVLKHRRTTWARHSPQSAASCFSRRASSRSRDSEFRSTSKRRSVPRSNIRHKVRQVNDADGVPQWWVYATINAGTTTGENPRQHRQHGVPGPARVRAQKYHSGSQRLKPGQFMVGARSERGYLPSRSLSMATARRHDRLSVS